MRGIACFLIGHRLHCIAPLLNECSRCGAYFETDYFESRARGHAVRYKITASQMQNELKRRGLE